jgi:hypothetical protein
MNFTGPPLDDVTAEHFVNTVFSHLIRIGRCGANSLHDYLFGLASIHNWASYIP